MLHVLIQQTVTRHIVTVTIKKEIEHFMENPIVTLSCPWVRTNCNLHYHSNKKVLQVSV